jgi:3-isopropylmalate/(R)-2-methylmalate dehydratase small subunit
MEKTIRGQVWVFDNNVNTDVMAPMSGGSEWEARKKNVLHIRADFVEGNKLGDIIVAGRNWGCGSSRESAPANIKRLGIAAVVAESFGRIYFRNSVAIAHPVISCPGVRSAFNDGDEIELDIETAKVTNLTTGARLQGQPYAPMMLEIMSKGGLMADLREKLVAAGRIPPRGAE